MTSIFIFGFIVIFLGLELLNFFLVGRGLIAWLIQISRTCLTGTRLIEIPENLTDPIANGLITVGSQLIVGESCEWSEDQVARFAISPELVREAPGSLLLVTRIDQSRLNFKPQA